MKRIFSLLIAAGISLAAVATDVPGTEPVRDPLSLETIQLLRPDTGRGGMLMQALAERNSIREYADEVLDLQDLSDLLWAANGVSNHGKRTAPSSMNSQDISIYVVRADGTFRYDPHLHLLELVSPGDHRQAMRGSMPAVNLVLIAEDGSKETARMNVGYVSQNIYLACTALDMATVAARGSMDEKAFNEACKISGKQKIMLQHPVGYPKR